MTASAYPAVEENLRLTHVATGEVFARLRLAGVELMPQSCFSDGRK